MKIALVHDYIKEYGGAERVLETLLEIFPDTTVYTSLFLPEYLGPHKERFKKYTIKTSFFQYIPFKQKLISPLRLLSPFAFKHFDLSDYDIIIVSQTGAYFPNLVPKTKNQRLIAYVHTPPRYLYGYKTAREWKKNPLLRVLGETANHFLRMVDFRASENVDQFIANSEEVAARIKKFYRREAIVINPPVDVSSIKYQVSSIKQREDSQNTKYEIPDTEYYLAGGRLARAKGMDVIVKAFNENKKTLKIFGRGFAGYEEELKSKVKGQKSQVEFLGEVTDEEKFELMRNAKAFVFASYDEDFGITPVEAMGVGTPVIAYKSGGVKETVIDKKTGIFFDENTPEELNKALEKFEQSNFESKAIIKHVEKFSKERFEVEIKKIIEKNF